jgi:hypothetical protein
MSYQADRKSFRKRMNANRDSINYNLYKALNVRLGFSPKDGRKKLPDDYHGKRGWDSKTGIPTEETLK